MTTIIRARDPLDTLSMNTQPGRRRSKRLAAYDEEDGDFKFTRGSKRSKTEAVAPDPTPVSSRSKQSAATHAEPQTEIKKVVRRKMSFSTPKAEGDNITQPKRATKKSKRSSIEKGRNSTAYIDGTGYGEVEGDDMDLVGVSTTDKGTAANLEGGGESTKIALPFTDTPIINRNKELRKKGTGGRRSSLGMRGRRASSLIDNGHSAIPHHQVESSQFYKHIEAEGLSEPRRMKQLLTWCGERSLGAKPSHNIVDSAAVLAARAIQESILKDFSNRSELSDWFSRDETARPTVIKKPNPLNLQNAEKIGELEQRIKRLEEERAQLKSLKEPPPPLPPLLDLSGAPPSPSALDASLLDPEDANILCLLTTSSARDLASKTEARLKTVQADIEFQVDQLADGVHKLEQACQMMDGVASKVLALSAVQLDERERGEKERVGTRDLPIQEVLRTLSRIMPSPVEVGVPR